jgi:hypothetical protein
MRRALLAAVSVAAVSAALTSVAAAAPGQNGLTYAVIGDTPYGAAQVANFHNDIDELNANHPNLVIHLGDIKNGSTKCRESASNPDPTGNSFEFVRDQFNRLKAIAYTPGDNEWTDCHRANNGGYVPTERLAVIRSMFFPVHGQTLGTDPRTVDYQSDAYPENTAWQQAAVQFGLVDVPGSNNDWLTWFDPTQGFDPSTGPDDPGASLDQIAEVTDRTAADLDWIDHIFDQAEANNAKAVALGIQADMWDPAFFDSANNGVTGPTPAAQSDHFTPIVQELAKRAVEFGKPVLLLNGDSHHYGQNNPLADPNTPQNQIYGLTYGVPNLTRITVQGSTSSPHQWLRLQINPAADPPFKGTAVSFKIQP